MARLLLLLPLILSGAGCVPKFKAPKAEAPHAVVEFRAVYHMQSDAFLTHQVTIDGLKVPMSIPNHVNSKPIVKVVRVPATPSRWRVMSELTHADAVRKRGPTLVRETSACAIGAAVCGEPRIEERDRWVTEYVTEARCAAQLVLQPQAGETYRLQYDFYGPADCSFTLLEHSP